MNRLDPTRPTRSKNWLVLNPRRCGAALPICGRSALLLQQAFDGLLEPSLYRATPNIRRHASLPASARSGAWRRWFTLVVMGAVGGWFAMRRWAPTGGGSRRPSHGMAVRAPQPSMWVEKRPCR